LRSDIETNNENQLNQKGRYVHLNWSRNRLMQNNLKQIEFTVSVFLWYFM